MHTFGYDKYSPPDIFKLYCLINSRYIQNMHIFDKLICNNMIYLKYSALEGLLQDATLFDELTAATPSWETRSVVDQTKPG